MNSLENLKTLKLVLTQSPSPILLFGRARLAKDGVLVTLSTPTSKVMLIDYECKALLRILVAARFSLWVNGVMLLGGVLPQTITQYLDDLDATNELINADASTFGHGSLVLRYVKGKTIKVVHIVPVHVHNDANSKTLLRTKICKSMPFLHFGTIMLNGASIQFYSGIDGYFYACVDVHAQVDARVLDELVGHLAQTLNQTVEVYA